MICKYLVGNIFKRAQAHYFWTQLNDFKYCDLVRIILFTINHLFVHSEVVTSIAINTKSFQHYSFIFTQSNGSKYCYVSLTIQLNTSYLFTHS